MQKSLASFVVFALFLGLSGCAQDLDSQFGSTCLDMANSVEGYEKDEKERFCNCVQRATFALPYHEKAALSRVMKNAETGDELRLLIEQEAASGELSNTGAREFFDSTMRCSVRTVIR